MHANTFNALYLCAGDTSLANGATMKLQRPQLARHQWALGRLAEFRRCLQLSFNLACLILCNKLVPARRLTNHNQPLWLFNLWERVLLAGTLQRLQSTTQLASICAKVNQLPLLIQNPRQCCCASL